MVSLNPNPDRKILGDDIYLYEPRGKADAGPPGDPSAPSLVILCTWVGGATPRRINKYVSQYQTLYPAASVLVLTSNVLNVAFRPLNMVRSRLQPACDAIRQILTEAAEGVAEPGILLHMFSHGGAVTGCQLALAMEESDDQGAPFLIGLRCVILDCCPGDNSLDKSYGAARVAVPNNPAAQLLGKALLYPAMSVVVGLQNAGFLRSVQELRDLLNDTNTFGSSPGRLYIYTKDDPVVGWTDVEDHIEEARILGHRVGQVAFEHGAHCGLIMENPARYWEAVRRFWSDEDIADLAVSGPDRSIVRSRL
ncbi:unnamed protein product [Penicillium salamii]|uniref:Uncharacterized protein n=1 Tax=Penicillium salamii TaxID=1612424 RepID=A0A9W4IYP8_9EURO|nr:unnamed protein product [Penicillium salamii]CAG8361552.1 unnamed protein product [Penicillium salamii]CAG8365719.1 unnamed protein product [Penicillium salamii]CAG8387224.1 unnamed protein product [Penicillium salamii]